MAIRKSNKSVKNGKYFQGEFKPDFPKKYRGDPKKIIYRSSWEFKFMRQLDSDPNVVMWESEEFSIPYLSPKDGKMHRYFVDFRYKTADGQVWVVEIKPFSQTQPPKQGSKRKATYIKEVFTFGINTSKWRAMEKYCNANGFKFKIVTEKELGLGGPKKNNS